MVFDSPLSLQGENANSTSSVYHCLLEDPILVPILLELLKVSSYPTNSARSGGDANTTGVPDETGSTPTDSLAYLRQSYSSQEFLHRLQASFSPPGEIKPTQTMDPPLLNGLAGVTSKVEIPFRDLSDVINFLADILLKATNINLLIPIAHQYPQYMNRWMESV